MRCNAWLILCALPVLGSSPPAAGATPEPGLKKNVPETRRCRQFIVVTTRDWTTVAARVLFFERADAGSPWKLAAPACDAVVGRKGLAWGIGLHGSAPAGAPVKQEGDDRAPAGVFGLEEIFGYAAPAAAGITAFPYRQLTASSEGIDDSRSRYYNRIVDASRIKARDWTISEIMTRPRESYRWGVVVEHNWGQIPGRGSCIFLHTWLGPGRGTSGCTAMSRKDLLAIIRKLDSSKLPLLVQLPAGEYEKLKAGWGLP